MENETGFIYEIEFRNDGGLNVKVWDGEALVEVFSVPPHSKFKFLDNLLQRAVVVKDD